MPDVALGQQQPGRENSVSAFTTIILQPSQRHGDLITSKSSQATRPPHPAIALQLRLLLPKEEQMHRRDALREVHPGRHRLSLQHQAKARTAPHRHKKGTQGAWWAGGKGCRWITVQERKGDWDGEKCREPGFVRKAKPVCIARYRSGGSGGESIPFVLRGALQFNVSCGGKIIFCSHVIGSKLEGSLGCCFSR